MSQPSAVPKIFRVEENDGDCDIVPEVSDHVLREGEHLGQLGMVNAVRGATKGVSVVKGNTLNMVNNGMVYAGRP